MCIGSFSTTNRAHLSTFHSNQTKIMCKTRTCQSVFFVCFSFEGSDPGELMAPVHGGLGGVSKAPFQGLSECAQRANDAPRKQDDAQTFCTSCLTFLCCCSSSSGPCSASPLSHPPARSPPPGESSTLRHATIPLMYRYYRDKDCKGFFFFPHLAHAAKD